MAIVLNITAKKGADVEISKIIKRVKSLDKNVNSMAKTARFARNAFIGLVGAGLAFRGLKSAFGVFIGFEETLSKIKAIAKPTIEEMAALTSQIKELGATTVFTASQVGGAGLALSKLGFTASQVIGTLPGVINLAAASGEELSESAETMAATLRAFGKEAENSMEVADLMAKSFSGSSLTLEKFGVAMRNVAPVAREAGISLAETTALIATLTDRGVEAATAGAQLRFAMVDLLSPTSKISAALDGASLKTHSFTEIMDLMSERGVNAFETLGKKGGLGMQILLQAGSEAVREMTAAFEDNKGAAEEMAKVMIDNVGGSLKLLKSAWDDFTTSLLENQGVFRRTIDSITDGISLLSAAVKTPITVLEKLHFEARKTHDEIQNINRQLDISTADRLTMLLTGSALSFKTTAALEKDLDIQGALFDMLQKRIRLEKSITTGKDPGLGGDPAAEAKRKEEEEKREAERIKLLGEKQAERITIKKAQEALVFDIEREEFEARFEQQIAAQDREEQAKQLFLDLKAEKDKEHTDKLIEQLRLRNKAEKESSDAVIAAETLKQLHLQQTISVTQSLFGAGLSLLALDRENAKKQKAIAMARVVFSSGIAIFKALEDPIFGIAKAFAIGLKTSATLSQMNAQKFSHGGVVGGNQVVGDSVHTVLERGERVVSNPEISGIGGLQNLENFLRDGLQNQKTQISVSIKDEQESDAMAALARIIIPFIGLELKRA